jgi:hypothetical protein
VAWADAAREAGQLGAGQDTVRALASGAGQALTSGTRVVVAAHGEVLLARWLPPGAGASSVRVGPLPHLQEVAATAARRPAYVVVLADRDGTDIITHANGDQLPGERFPAGGRPGAPSDPHPDRPPAQHHGPRHVTDSEPESGGQRTAEFIAGRVSEAADGVGAHIVLGAGDRHILDAIEGHLSQSVGPITTIAGGRGPDGLDEGLSSATALMPRTAAGPGPPAREATRSPTALTAAAVISSRAAPIAELRPSSRPSGPRPPAMVVIGPTDCDR